MIRVDNHGQHPSGEPVATVSIDGVSYNASAPGIDASAAVETEHVRRRTRLAVQVPAVAAVAANGVNDARAS